MNANFKNFEKIINAEYLDSYPDLSTRNLGMDHPLQLEFPLEKNLILFNVHFFAFLF